MILGGGGTLNRSLTSILKGKVSSFADAGGKLGVQELETSKLTGSDVPDDREVSDEDGEAEDDARDPDLSGFTGFILCLSGEIGVISFGESVGVPL